uniref:ATP binding cassette subfamily A member 3 n=1 Tax=Rousettus aegyptiacus TaxID=9407 RepID=A0A7J8EW17_ROUAE|nr:ATP binding cassette subfamily A member 3 [Rousettus aegyptiacus]
MDLLELNKFMVLLWKNFILKRRQFFTMVAEIILTLLFAGTLLLTRTFTVIRKNGPYNYSRQPVDELPAFLGRVPYPGLWELAFVPSKSVVVRTIIEAVKRDLHYNFKVQGFPSERDFEDYVKQGNNSQRVMVAFVFDHEFKNSYDPLPLQAKYYLRFRSVQRNKYIDFDRPRSWQTGDLFPTPPSVGPRNEQDADGGSPGYFSEGFLVMQHALDKAIMRYHDLTAAQALLGDVNVFVQRFPYPEYYHDYFFNFLGILIPLVILFIFSMNHFTLVQSLVWEKENRLKHIQFLSGVYILAYWLSALLWDFIIFSASCCLLLGVFKYCQLDLFLAEYHFLDTMLIFMLYGWAAIPLMYLLSFLFTRGTSAYIKLVLFNYLSGIFSLLIDSIFEFENSHSMPNATRNFMLHLLLVFPNYNLAKCITYYTTFHQMKKWCSLKQDVAFLPCDKENTTKSIYSLEEKMIGKYLVIMSITGFTCLFLAFFWESILWKLRTFFNRYAYFGIYKTFKKKDLSKELSGDSEDEDVENERKRILEQPQVSLSSAVLVKELTKIYFKCPVILAVRNISIAIQRGDCFGLLGFNGAGKTTTFQMLTGEETATSGEVFLDGFCITKDLWKVKSRIGYCPQTDALLEYMTGREIMTMYARLWGISESQIQLYVNSWLNLLQLEPHADKIIRTYSGGCKRRLSTAIALMGKPTVILLDEPSTGMDPVARRLLWAAVTRARESGKAIVITSHRTEECDAFCTRLAIMVKGKFMCLGSPQHLKNKFGNIYTLKIKVKIDTPEHKLEDLKFFITTTFPGSVLKQENQGNLNYYIPSKDNSWAKVFGILEEAKDQFSLEDYSISQITLEQVFLTFANPENREMNV